MGVLFAWSVPVGANVDWEPSAKKTGRATKRQVCKYSHQTTRRKSIGHSVQRKSRKWSAKFASHRKSKQTVEKSAATLLRGLALLESRKDLASFRDARDGRTADRKARNGQSSFLQKNSRNQQKETFGSGFCWKENSAKKQRKTGSTANVARTKETTQLHSKGTLYGFFFCSRKSCACRQVVVHS